MTNNKLLRNAKRMMHQVLLGNYLISTVNIVKVFPLLENERIIFMFDYSVEVRSALFRDLCSVALNIEGSM